MARALSPALDAIQTAAVRREPAFRVEVFDTRAGLNTTSEIVRGLPLHPTTGPREVTADVLSVDVEERTGDHTEVAASRVALRLADPTGVYCPRTGAERRWLRRGNVLRIWVGDARVPTSEWPVMFVGRLVGTPGVVRRRDAGAVAEVSMKAVGREADLLRADHVSESFGLGTDYGSMIESIATGDAGLDADELALPSLASRVTGHASNQFAEQPPLVSIAQILFPFNLAPRFRGDGKLGAVDLSITKAPARTYADDSLVFVVETPFSELNPVNSVRVVGLDANQTKITQPRQTLAEVQLTTGYFSPSERVEAFWSDDHTLLAEAVALEAVRPVGSAINFGGADETFSLIGAPGPEGSVGTVLRIDTGHAPWVIGFLTSALVVLAAIPDQVLGAKTAAVGRVREATELSIALLMMTRVARGIYRFVGCPFEYVFREIVGVAERDGLLTDERRELRVENHLVQNQTDADAAARDVLFLESGKGNPRRLEMLHDLAVEPGDVLELAGGRRFFVRGIRYTLRRGGDALRAVVDCLEVTPGSFV